MGFKLRKRQNWLFLPAAMLEVAVERILAVFNIHPLWQALILILIALFLTVWILRGKAIFHRSFYLTYRDIERETHRITPNMSEEQIKRLFPEIFAKQEPKGKTIHIPNEVVKEKIRVRKKRFEL